MRVCRAVGVLLPVLGTHLQPIRGGLAGLPQRRELKVGKVHEAVVMLDQLDLRTVKSRVNPPKESWYRASHRGLQRTN